MEYRLGLHLREELLPDPRTTPATEICSQGALISVALRYYSAGATETLLRATPITATGMVHRAMVSRSTLSGGAGGSQQLSTHTREIALGWHST